MYDTVPVYNTILVLDTVPVYMVYEVTTSVGLEHMEILILDNEIRLNFQPQAVKVYDLAGILLIDKPSDRTVNISDLSQGIYILKVHLQRGEFQTKFLNQ